MPHDIWIYNYAKSVFEARYTHFKTGVFEPPGWYHDIHESKNPALF